jgi:hypothetical protein
MIEKLESIKRTGDHWRKYLTEDEEQELRSRFPWLKFDPEETEKENMRSNGYRIIYDAGNLVLVKD